MFLKYTSRTKIHAQKISRIFPKALKLKGFLHRREILDVTSDYDVKHLIAVQKAHGLLYWKCGQGKYGLNKLKKHML